MDTEKKDTATSTTETKYPEYKPYVAPPKKWYEDDQTFFAVGIAILAVVFVTLFIVIHLDWEKKVSHKKLIMIDERIYRCDKVLE